MTSRNYRGYLLEETSSVSLGWLGLNASAASGVFFRILNYWSIILGFAFYALGQYGDQLTEERLGLYV